METRHRRTQQLLEPYVAKDQMQRTSGGGLQAPAAENQWARQQPTSSRRACVAFAVVAILIGLAIIGLGAYLFLQIEAHRLEARTEEEYLRELVQTVNEAPDARWKARFNPSAIRVHDFSHKSLRNVTAVRDYFERIEAFFHSDVMAQHLKELATFDGKTLPRHFDAREKWPLCASLHDVPNQGGCGSCFAVAAMGVASDRTCIQSNGTLRPQLSAEDVLGCCTACGDCYGGDPLKALTYWAVEGVVTGDRDGCRPYEMSTTCGTPCSPAAYPEAERHRTCRRSCQKTYYRSAYNDDKHMGSIAYTLYPRRMTLDQAGTNRSMVSSIIGHFNATTAGGPLNLEATRNLIRKELWLYGPTTFAFPITEEFLHYESGVFHPIPEKDFAKRVVYWHVARLIGWGRDERDRFHWLAINSFGAEWGENGLFRIDPTLLEKFGLEYEAGLL